MVRKHTLGIRLDDLELTTLQKRAEDNHLKVSSYVRWFVFNAGLFVKTKAERIERISRGVPKPLKSKHTIKQLNAKNELVTEMKMVFEKGVKLEKMSKDRLKLKILQNRNKPSQTLDQWKLSKLNLPNKELIK